jgi:hypothetical protein
MKSRKNAKGELLVIAKNVVAKNRALADPTCEEGGDAKLGEVCGANASKTTLCETDPADFCITEKKEGAKASEVFGSSAHTLFWAAGPLKRGRWATLVLNSTSPNSTQTPFSNGEGGVESGGCQFNSQRASQGSGSRKRTTLTLDRERGLASWETCPTKRLAA